MARYVSKATSKRIVGELTKRRQKTEKLAGRWWGIYGRKHYRAAVSWEMLQLTEKEAWFWDVLTEELVPGSDEWRYKRIERLDLVAYIEQDIKDHEFKISACPHPYTLAH